MGSINLCSFLCFSTTLPKIGKYSSASGDRHLFRHTMQTKKKVPARSVSREHTNPRSCRQQKKGSTACERKVADMITSSTKKQKNGTYPSF